MEKMGAEAMTEACEKSFFINFRRYKSMVQAFLSNNHAELLRADPSDESLKAMVNDHIGEFSKSSEQALSITKFHAATQIDPKIHSKKNKVPGPK